MASKNITKPGDESAPSQEGGSSGGGHGSQPQYPNERIVPQQQGYGAEGRFRMPPQQQGYRGEGRMQPQQYGGRGGYDGGSGRGGPMRGGMAPQWQYGGRMQPQQYGGRGGYDGDGGLGGPKRGGMAPQQQYGAPPEYYQQQGRGTLPRGGGAPQQHRGGVVDRTSGGGRPFYPPASRPQGPELHQVTQVPYQAVATPQPMPSGKPSESHFEAGSSSSSWQHEPPPIKKTQQQPIPESRKLMKLPLRPDNCSTGAKCIVKANHFLVELKDNDLFQYGVKIMPKVSSMVVNRALMSTLVKQYGESHLGNRLPAYDGENIIYTAGPLPFDSTMFKITLIDENDGSDTARRGSVFNVAIKFTSRVSVDNLKQFLQGIQVDSPRQVLLLLRTVLQQRPTTKGYSLVGRLFNSPHPGDIKPLVNGLETCMGFYLNILPTQMGLSLNIDIPTTPLIEPLPVIDFVNNLLNRNITDGAFSKADRTKVNKSLGGVKMEVTHRGTLHRKYRIIALTSHSALELTFHHLKSGKMKSVADYYRENYGITIRNAGLPCLQAGNPRRPQYFPMEVCKIVKGQRYSNILNERQLTAFRKVTCQGPKKREETILRAVEKNDYDKDPYAQEFGIKVYGQLASVDAHILPTPWLQFHNSGKVKVYQPQTGRWTMFNKKVYRGVHLNKWMCINFAANVSNSAALNFCERLVESCRFSGMRVTAEPVLPVHRASPDNVEGDLKAHFHKLKPTGEKLDLLVAILPDIKDSLYGRLKRICETELGVVSQCCSAKHVFHANLVSLSNMSLKINMKLGGKNTVLVDALSRCLPLVSDCATIIFGADVSHPAFMEDSMPSIAAVVASIDWPEVTKYAGLVCAQKAGTEIIQDLYKTWQDPVRGPMFGGMVRDLLLSFYEATQLKPKRIIFYRDGVGESQFFLVLFHELNAIRKACASLDPNYKPLVTFIVVVKRHRTRLFANNDKQHPNAKGCENVAPGTVVDSKICHPSEFDFFLCSHPSSSGTSRPAHYHVLWDENKFKADELQSLTYNLCYTYARCTNSVSIVPPVYYAHLAAYRGRCYTEPESSDSAPGANAAVTPLPALKENLKNVMFYC